MSFLKSLIKVGAPIAGAAIGTAIGGPVGGKIGGALGGAVGGAVAKSGASNKATAATLAGVKEARGVSDRAYNDIKGINDPYLRLGAGGANALTGRLNIPSAAPGYSTSAPGASVAGGGNALTTGGATPPPTAPTGASDTFDPANLAGGAPAAGGAAPVSSPGAGVAPQPVAGAPPTSPGTFGSTENPTYAPPSPWKDPGNFTFGVDQFRADPGYQYRLDESRRQVEGAAGAQGSRLSGNTLKELSDRAGNIADQTWGRERDYAAGRSDVDRNFGRSVYADDRNFGRGVYTDDRGYLTDRFDRGTDDLFRTTTVGQNAAGLVGNAATNNAKDNVDLALGGAGATANNALTQGDIGADLATTVGGVISTGLDAYGRKKPNALSTIGVDPNAPPQQYY